MSAKRGAGRVKTFAEYMDLVPMARQMQALEAAGIPVDPSKWTDDDLDRASDVLNKLWEDNGK